MPESRPNSNPPSEKPHHYSYLKGFRTEQCLLFLQHKCTQHRPFTCFNWHFANQRRRRPRIRRDGHFTYSADVYCTVYDETTGTCPNGDDCRFLHRNSGDTERRYHLRYYKTATCVYDTDSKGNCSKNGAHCCFAHCAEDLRQPVYDPNEGHGVENGPAAASGALRGDLAPGSPPKAPMSALQHSSPAAAPHNLVKVNAERDKGFVLEDMRWHDQKFVLVHYKTELCKKPPRSCRQGYACPFYHNERDRRRSPRKHKYRSTPCPHVKHADEWGEPNDCDKGDGCSYCHTRTEQQFHPEIYKSTKCYDVLQTKTCPRGPFCAFAHREDEMKGTKDLPDEDDELVGAPSTLPSKALSHASLPSKAHHIPSKPQPIAKPRSSGLQNSLSMENDFPGLPQSVPLYSCRGSSSDPQQLSGSLGSLASSGSNSMINTVGMAVGEEDLHQQVLIRKQLIAIENDPLISVSEKSRLKHNVLQYHSALPHSPELMSPASVTGRMPGSVSDPFDMIGGHSLDEEYLDQTVDDLDIREIEKEIGKASGTTVDIPGSAGRSSRTSSMSSSLSSSYPGLFGSFGIPVGPVTPPYASGPYPAFSSQVQTALVSPNPYGTAFESPFSMSISSPVSKCFHPNSGSAEQSPSASPYTAAEVEIRRLKEELREARGKLAAWEDSWIQAKQACEAWKREASENAEKSKRFEAALQGALADKEKLADELRLARERKTSDSLSDGVPQTELSLEHLSLNDLIQLRQQRQTHLERIDKMVYDWIICRQCRERTRCILFGPCNHSVLCEECAVGKKECVYCGQTIEQQRRIEFPI
ncbi:putative E3 ubiquitin-protein ligase UNKL isoform X2 [Corticium candelabrum]|uniref:putative E3 ubiquitin-protein ligase UNKL isoform X2 n=1 Tax=Corticium candelabrum TaxID=121492 RepID=UPI002E3644C3|nr:putative E3 ubiquitin-protein ligase UNKL isoform X2 [Corticium candelabrum]